MATKSPVVPKFTRCRCGQCGNCKRRLARTIGERVGRAIAERSRPDGLRATAHESADVPVVPRERFELLEDPDPDEALDLLERQASEIRVRANAAVRRLLTAPTSGERQRLELLPPELALWGLSPLPYTVKSMYAVLGTLFFFSDLFAQTFSTLTKLTTRPPTFRQGSPLSPEQLRRLSSQTEEIPAHRLHVRGSSETRLIPAQRSKSEREIETADDKARTDLSKAAREQVTDRRRWAISTRRHRGPRERAIGDRPADPQPRPGEAVRLSPLAAAASRSRASTSSGSATRILFCAVPGFTVSMFQPINPSPRACRATSARPPKTAFASSPVRAVSVTKPS